MDNDGHVHEPPTTTFHAKPHGDYHKQHFETRCVNGGYHPDPITGAVIPPLSLATTFQQKSPGLHTGFEYSRTGNPTRKLFEDAVKSLENGKFAHAFASGSATTATCLHLLKAGDVVLSMDDVYGGTHRFFSSVLRGVEFKFVDFTNPASYTKHATKKTKMVWIETPTNPLLKIADIEDVCTWAHTHGMIVCVDNTFATPAFQKPLDLGADIVVHSITKYINGHADVVGGIAITNHPVLSQRLAFLSNAIGPVPSPFDCWLALRGLKTFHLRMERHQVNGLAVAKFVEKHPLVEKVLYPFLESHPQYAIAKKQMSGFGGMVTMFLKGGIDVSRKFLEELEIFILAESLGGVESLAEHPAIMTHAAVPPAERAKLGITDGLVRLSVGIETLKDIIDDLSRSLDSAYEVYQSQAIELVTPTSEN